MCAKTEEKTIADRRDGSGCATSSVPRGPSAVPDRRLRLELTVTLWPKHVADPYDEGSSLPIEGLGFVAEGASGCWSRRSVRLHWSPGRSAATSSASPVVDTDAESMNPARRCCPSTAIRSALSSARNSAAGPKQVGVMVTVLLLDRDYCFDLRRTPRPASTKNTTRASATVDVLRHRRGHRPASTMSWPLAGGILELAGVADLREHRGRVGRPAAQQRPGRSMEGQPGARTRCRRSRPLPASSQNGQPRRASGPRSPWGGNYLSLVTVDATGGLPNVCSPTVRRDRSAQPSAQAGLRRWRWRRIARR